MLLSLFKLLLLASPVALFYIVRAYLRQQAEQKLRENPPPRRFIEVSLPYGVNDSNERMKRFYRKVASAASADKAQRKQGLGQIDVVYLAEIPKDAIQPEIRFLVYSDPDQMDKVKRAIKQAFDGQSDLNEPPHDPLAEIADELRPPKPPETPELDNGETEHYDED